MAKRVLLTVSGSISPQLESELQQGKRPVPDYLAMSQKFDADLLDYPGARAASGFFGKLIEKLAGRNALLAWACFIQARRYRVIFTDGEQVGIPLALLLKSLGWLLSSRPRHLMLVHILSVGKKMLFFDKLGIHSHIDAFFVYSTWQKHFIQDRWKVPPERVVLTPFMVDARFFHPGNVTPSGPDRLICAVGQEWRDYPTLLAAARALNVNAQVRIATASPWSKRPDTTQGMDIPPNVTTCRLNQYDLRQLYADSRFMVMPLADVSFQAGVTAILEAMAMERAVICTRTKGQTDVIVDGVQGLYVPPGDVPALRAAIERLLDHPDEAERMGKAGRKLIEEQMNLDLYVERLNAHVQAALPK